MTTENLARIACPSCQAEFLDEGLNFCGRCGADLRRGGDLTPVSGRDVAAGGGSAFPVAVPPGRSGDMMLGQVVENRYRVLDRIGAGGMGAVYRVEHVKMGKIAALKMLHPTLTADREIVKRFRREAEAVSLLTHPNTVQVFDFGEWQGGLYMVMEYVKGRDLGELVRNEGAMPWERAAPLLAQICDALAEAHDKGIVHRDLKPENILVARGRDNRELCKVLDFGLAKLKLAHDDPSAPSVTARGSVIGTPYYMSPEQIRAEEPDARSDIYSFGATMYRVLTGEPPFVGKTPIAVLTQHLNDRLVPLAERRPELTFDARVEAIVARCMEKKREKRFTTIDEVRQAIDDARGPDRSPLPSLAASPDGKNSQVTIAGVPQPRLLREDFDRFERLLKVRRVVGVMTLPLVLAVAGAAGYLAYKHEPAQRPVEEEVEPNDEPRTANLVADGRTVRGHIGKRVSVEESDRDFYHLHVDAGPAVGRLELTGIPNMDLRVALFDGAGKRLAETDAGGPGASEVIPNYRLEAGDYYVEVREVWVVGKQATENVTDWYTLTPRWHRLGSDEEAEPDDTPQTAIALPLDVPMKGYLGRAGDVDFYYPEGVGGGTLDGTVSGIEGVDLKVVVLPPGAQVADDVAKTPGAKVFDAGTAGGGEKFALPWPSGGPAPFVVVLRKDKAPDAQGHRPPLVGVDAPYTITLHRSKQ